MTKRVHPGGIAAIALPALAIAALFAFHAAKKDDDALVVYCAHDAENAERVIRIFEKKTGIKVVPKFDTEATKSLALVELIRAERNNPRCDVFWNNEALGTMELAENGLLLTYSGENHARIPARFKDPENRWAGFAARLRVFIVNANAMPATRKALENAEKNNVPKMAIAKPLYGTTLTHFTLLAKQLGFENLQKWFRGKRADGLNVLNGNAAVKDAVAAGGCDFGWTDTDDFLEAKRPGAPVATLPVLLPDGKTIAIPNTVAIVKDAKHLDKAKAFVDFLLSEECETILANGPSGQIPLGPVDESKIPPFVKKIAEDAENAAPLTPNLLPLRRQCVEWLAGETPPPRNKTKETRSSGKRQTTKKRK